MKNLNGITNNGLTQPSLALAGIISYVSPTGKKTIRFGEKDRAANCLHTLCKGDKVNFQIDTFLIFDANKHNL